MEETKKLLQEIFNVEDKDGLKKSVQHNSILLSKLVDPTSRDIVTGFSMALTLKQVETGREILEQLKMINEKLDKKEEIKSTTRGRGTKKAGE